MELDLYKLFMAAGDKAESAKYATNGVHPTDSSNL